MKQNKTCSKCFLEKPLHRFSKRKESIDGYRHWCKDCATKNSLEQRAKDPAKYKEVDRKTNAKNSKRRQATDKQWRKENPEKLKQRTLKRYYGIDLSDYNLLLKKQNDCCAICKVHKDELKLPLCVDHCHKTGKVRGLLCKSCNSGIGFLKDSYSLCRSAASYLKDTDPDEIIARED